MKSDGGHGQFVCRDQHGWVEIDLDGITQNYEKIRSYLDQKTKLLAVVKADAYGHGAYPVASQMEDLGADYLGVSLPEEALKLRNNGIKMPIFIMAPVLEEWYFELIRCGVTLSLSSLESARALNKVALEMDEKAVVHIEIDTGMGRYGIEERAAIEFVREVKKLKGLELEGLFTHFASADEANGWFAKKQLESFQSLRQTLESESIDIPLYHCANSSAAVNFESSHMDMVRIGSLLYGQDLTGGKKIDVKSSWDLKTKLVSVREMPAGANIGYGDDCRLKRDSIIGVIPLGFSDGVLMQTIQRPYTFVKAAKFALKSFMRYLDMRKTRETVRFRGERYPVIGRVGMQHTTIDLTGADNPRTGEIISMYVRKASVNPLIPKTYIWKGKPFHWHENEMMEGYCKTDLDQSEKTQEVFSDKAGVELHE